MLYPTNGKDFSFVHVTGHTNQSQWPQLPMDVVWQIFCSRLQELRRPAGHHVNAFVLMHNHFHLLMTEKVSCIEKTIDELSQKINRDFADQTGSDLKIFRELPEYSLINDYTYLRFTYRYIYQNPVKAGIVMRAENYKFSTLSHLLGKKHDSVFLNVTDTFGLMYDPMRILKWINDPRPNADFLQLH
jgi:putative transposase